MPELSESLKRIFIFTYQFNDSRNLSEVARRLEKNKFVIFDPAIFREPIDSMKDYLVRTCGALFPENINHINAIAAKSSTVHPPMIYFLFLQYNENGGLLILFETKDSWYSYEKVLHSMRAFDRNAGIKSRYIGLFIPDQKSFLIETLTPEELT